MSVYNPASTRVKEASPGTVDVAGVTTLIFPPGTVIPLGHGSVYVSVATATGAIYAVSTSPGDGATMVFPFLRPIGTLIFGTVAGMVQDPIDVTVDAYGRLVLGINVPTPSSVEKVGAYYIPA